MAPMKCPAHKDGDKQLQESSTLTHLARRWKTSRRQVRRLIQRGDLPFKQVSGQIRVPNRAVVEFEIQTRMRPVPR